MTEAPPLRPVLVTLLVSLTLLAGCTKQEQPLGEPIEPASTTVPTSQAPPTAATTPPPAPPPTSSTPPPPPTQPTPPAPAPPAPKKDLWINQSGWVKSNGPTDANMTLKIPFQVAAGVTQLTADAFIQTITPDPPTALPAAVPAADHPVALNVTLLDPDGRVIANFSYVQVGDGNYTADLVSGARINVTGTPVRVGDYVLVVNIQGGASDGASAGDRYHTKIRMS